MLFPTIDFFVFFLIIAALMAVLRDSHAARKLVLVAASYIFYAMWNWRFCGLLATSSTISYVAGRLIDAAPNQARRSLVKTIAVTLHLCLLGIFKYFDFFVSNANAALRALGVHAEIPFVEILLPVGISFFTFHGISYVLDVYRRDVAVCRRPADMFLYLAFFPQLVAGPIVRASKFLPQLYARSTAPFDMQRAAMLILGGLVKKTILANYLATDLVDPVFADPTHASSLDLLLGLYGYAAQIYCDFSAYSDIAIGLAALLGYEFPDNFNQPYRSTSLQDFWRRWHISLSSWLRDYLYISLGGSRGGGGRTARNLAITMLLGGLWHGAQMKFVMWGALHGTGLVLERWARPITDRLPDTRALRLLATLAVFHFVCLAWLFFRADDFDTAVIYLRGIFAFTPGISQITPFTLVLLVFSLSLHFVPRDLQSRLGRAIRTWPAWALGPAGGVAIAAISAAGPDGVAPFIYFQF
jgi:D-alanyl-lipoteichoic acid acyltransferase DltB (MBOAT superfamily)